MPPAAIIRRDLFRAALVAPFVIKGSPEKPLRVLFGRYAEEVGRGDSAALAELFAADARYRDVTFGTRLIGRDAIRNMFARTFAAVTSARYRIEHAAFDQDTIAVRWELSGVHQGPLLGMPASGRRISFRGASFLTVRSREVREQVDYLDRVGLERELGVRGAARE